MKNKKGFTLIELLAVIVILAAIALIATPIIMSVINDAKRGAAKNSAYGIIKAGELKMNTSNFKVPATYTEESEDLNYKGTKPEKLKLDIDKQGNIKLAAFIDEFCVVKDYHESEVSIDDNLKTADTCVNGAKANIEIINVERTLPSGNYYRIGDTIEFTITLENTGNATLTDIEIRNDFNANGSLVWASNDEVNENNNYVVPELIPGKQIEIKASYVVTRADAGNSLALTLGCYKDGREISNRWVEELMDIEELHKLEIKYKYSDGSTAAPSVIAYFLYGETYSYMSPTINGYTPDYAFVRSNASGMPEYDIEVTVTYTPNVIPQG